MNSPTMSYSWLRNLHLVFGLLSLPFLLMYAVSALQMAHSKWIKINPVVSERSLKLSPAISDSRELLRLSAVKGDLRSVQAAGGKWELRVQFPGTVHEVSYDAATGIARVKTSKYGVLGMLNRLHHAGGLWPAYLPLKLWGIAVGIVSISTIGLALTGLWMWWLRKQERAAGLVLILSNLIFAIVVLVLIRSAGP